MKAFKQHIINTCLNYLTQKVNGLNAIIREVNDAANAESKSSAGDKHETAKAMAQLEQEKLGNQLKEAELQLIEFNKYDFTKESAVISLGSLIETNKGYFLIASSIGKIEVDGKAVFVISNKSPLAIAFIGKKQKDTVSFNAIEYVINSIY